ncbi:MAG: HDOD domain-containing protein [bacterium]
MGQVEMDAELKKVVSQIDDLPTLPAVVTRIIGMVEDPSTSAEDLNKVISQDPSLTAKVLKLVNSAFYGFSRRISTVTEAVVILGFNTVKSLAVSASVFEVFEGGGSRRFDRVGMWEHSIATGVGAEMIGKRIRYPNVEEIMVAGILHSIGKVVIDLYMQDKVEQILDYVKTNKCSMLEAERDIIGVDHPRIGGWLAEQWNLPDNIVTAIRFYHQPREAPEDKRTLPMLIHIGDILARTKNIGWTGDSEIPPFREENWKELGVEEEDIKDILNQLEDRMDNADAFLEMSENSDGDDS